MCDMCVKRIQENTFKTHKTSKTQSINSEEEVKCKICQSLHELVNQDQEAHTRIEHCLSKNKINCDLRKTSVRGKTKQKETI